MVVILQSMLLAYAQNCPKLQRPIKFKIPCAVKSKPDAQVAVVKIQLKI